MSNHKRISIEAEETIKTLETLSILFYELHQKSIPEMENQTMDTTTEER